jgi:hypothetical protein
MFTFYILDLFWLIVNVSKTVYEVEEHNHIIPFKYSITNM